MSMKPRRNDPMVCVDNEDDSLNVDIDSRSRTKVPIRFESALGNSASSTPCERVGGTSNEPDLTRALVRRKLWAGQ